MRKRVAVIGAGWAGLSAAVDCTQAGHEVTLFESGTYAGGRASSLPMGGETLDNGQHILIGAYKDTLTLMRTVGVSIENSFYRSPLRITYPEGSGLSLATGHATRAFVLGVLRMRSLSLGARLRFLSQAARWRAQGFHCDPTNSVSDLCARLPTAVMRELIEPLCLAALNTAPQRASGQVFLTVLKDALFGGPGAADLLLPRRPLAALLPEPGCSWLSQRGTKILMRNRVIGLAPRENRSKDGSAGWAVETQSQIADFDHVIMATEAREAARLVRPWHASWADTAESLGFEPIITVWLKAPGAEPWTFPMMALHSNAESPAQFAFDCGALGGPSHTYAFVVSAAAAWVAQGLEKTAHAVVRQAQDAFNSLSNARGFHDAEVLEMRAIKRATFACLPGLKRPISFIRPGLLAAGDYIDGPYPATLEGAVRSGKEAATLIL